MPRKYTKRVENNDVGRKPLVSEDVEKNEQVYSEKPRYAESYTSLIMGIVVVIISTALLLAFVHNRNTNSNIIKPDTNEKTVNKDISNNNGNQTNYQISTVPTLTPFVENENDNSNVDKINSPKVDPLNAVSQSESTYTVQSGDTLWNIAERQYKSGYDWIEIAKANKLLNPGQINTGTKLILPKLEDKKIASDDQKSITTQDEQNNKINALTQNKIPVGSNYTVMKDDCLWEIAQRAYGDGTQWPKIARVNKLENPRIIHAGNVFIIPRT